MRWIALLLFLAAHSASAETIQGKVVRIADGDTLTILDAGKLQHKIRLAGIDAPERGQPFGQVSKQNLTRIAAGKSALVDWHKRDRYGRLVGTVYVHGHDIALEQIRVGLAWHYKEYVREQTPAQAATYAIREMDARRGRVGLWRDAQPVAPWDWRRKRSSNK